MSVRAGLVFSFLSFLATTTIANVFLRDKGDFDDLNDLFNGTVIAVPDTDLTREVFLLGTVVFSIRNMTCFDARLQNADASHQVVSTQTMIYNVTVEGIDLTCDLKWTYDGAIAGGASGTAQIYTMDNVLSTSLVVRSDSFDAWPPDDVDEGSCNATINVDKMEFQGGVVAFFANALDVIFRNQVENAIVGVLCEELGSITTGIEYLILNASDRVLSYYEDIPDEDLNPLLGEANLVVPDSVRLLNLSTIENDDWSWFVNGVSTIFTYLGSTVDDPAVKASDLAVNVVLRDNILDVDGRYVVFSGNITINEGTNPLTEHVLNLTELSVKGLDTTMEFGPLEVIGARTVHTTATWKNITAIMDLTVTIRPSSGEDSIIVEYQNPEVVERITVTVSFDDINADLSVLLAIDEDILGNLALGSLMKRDQVFPCMSSAVRAFNLTTLNLTVGNVREPEVVDFVSPGVDRVLSDTANAFHEMYVNSVMTALPTYAATDLKSMLNDMILRYFDNKANSECPEPIVSSGSQSVDFRDLLLDQEKSMLLGGSGTSPYGDVFPELKSLANSMFARPDAVNEVLVRPQTMNGTILFPNPNFLNLSLSTLNLTVATYNASIDNADSFGIPSLLLEPSEHSPYLLSNQIELGSGTLEQDTLRLNIGLSFTNPIYNFDEDINVYVDVQGLHNLLIVFLRINESSLLVYPLQDLGNIECWAATIPIRETKETTDFASIYNLTFLEAAMINLGADCTSCNTVGIRELSNMVDSLRQVGIWSGILTRILKVIEELAMGDDANRWLNQLIDNAHRSCPHDPLYDPSYEKKELEWMDFLSLTLSKDSIDTVLLSAGIASQLGLAVTALNIVPKDRDSFNGSLSVDVNELVDLTEWEETIDTWLNNIFGGDPTDSYEAIGINSIVREFLLDDEGRYSFPLDSEEMLFLGYNFTVSSVHIKGLDTFSAASIFNSLSKHVFQSRFTLDDVSVEMKIFETSTNEEIFITSGLEGVYLTIDVLLAIFEEILGGIQLGSMLRTDWILPCVVSTIDLMNITDLKMEISEIKEPVITGFLSEEVRDLLGTSTITLLDAYKSNITVAIQALVRVRVNDLVETFFETNENATCFTPLVNKDAGFVDFRDMFLNASAALKAGGQGDEPYGDLVWKILDALKKRVLSPNANGSPMLNDAVLRPFSEEQSSVAGQLYFSQAIVDYGTDNQTQFKIYDVTVDNVDSVGYPLYFLTPQEDNPHVVENALTVGASNVLKITSTIIIRVMESGFEVENEVLVTFEVDTMSLLPSVRALVDTNTLLEFPLRHIGNPACWLSTIPAPALNELGLPSLTIDPTMNLDSFGVLFDDIKVKVACIKCSSPDIDDLNTLGVLFDNPVLLSSFVENLSQSRAVRDWIGRLQYNASLECPFNAGYVSESEPNDDFAFKLEEFVDDSYIEVVAFACVGFVLMLIVLCIRRSIKSRATINHKNWLVSLTEEELRFVYSRQLLREEEKTQLCEVTKSMLTSEAVPFVFRFLMPLIILGNIALFLSGHINLGGSLTIAGQIAGQDISLPDFFSFSIAKSTIDMWNAGSKELAFIIAIFSGLWPYTKQLITLALLCAPPTKLSTARRGSVLRWLDSFGKWSMLDIYILVLSLITFRLTVVSPDGFLPKDFYKLETLVIPVWGLYANMIAQLVSQVSSHFVLHYHDKIVADGKRKIVALKAEIRQNDVPDDESTVCSDVGRFDMKSSLYDHSYKLGGMKTGKISKVGLGANIFIGTISAIALLFLILGCIYPSLNQELLGILGIAIEAGNDFEEAVYRYSFFDIVQLIIDEAKFVNTPGQYVGLGTLTALFIFSTLLVPLSLFLVLLGIWFAPMQKKLRMRFLFVIEILQAWQYLEVYIISLLLASWQLGGVSEFMFNERYCGEFGDAFDLLTYYGFVSQPDAQCFYNKANIGPSVYLLTFSAIVLAWLTNLVTKAASQKHEDDERSSWYNLKDHDVTFDTNTATDDDSVHSLLKSVRPVAPKFLDSFKWFLKESPGIANVSSSKLVLELQESALDMTPISDVLVDVKPVAVAAPVMMKSQR